MPTHLQDAPVHVRARLPFQRHIREHVRGGPGVRRIEHHAVPGGLFVFGVLHGLPTSATTKDLTTGHQRQSEESDERDERHGERGASGHAARGGGGGGGGRGGFDGGGGADGGLLGRGLVGGSRGRSSSASFARVGAVRGGGGGRRPSAAVAAGRTEMGGVLHSVGTILALIGIALPPSGFGAEGSLGTEDGVASEFLDGAGHPFVLGAQRAGDAVDPIPPHLEMELVEAGQVGRDAPGQFVVAQSDDDGLIGQEGEFQEVGGDGPRERIVPQLQFLEIGAILERGDLSRELFGVGIAVLDGEVSKLGQILELERDGALHTILVEGEKFHLGEIADFRGDGALEAGVAELQFLEGRHPSDFGRESAGDSRVVRGAEGAKLLEAEDLLGEMTLEGIRADVKLAEGGGDGTDALEGREAILRKE
mmetsp:Transcript_29559/g.87559  ORF Transcript_29559/g.87559 Transcript_29559/m.87559 type:complete len:422 (-) Transcript_29559:679-1944(-)